MNDKNEIILYQPDETVKLEVRFSEETVWLNRKQMASLFGRDVKTIGKHITNALAEELLDISVVANFATTASDGKTYNVEYYNLDVILSVGYRVKSRQGVPSLYAHPFHPLKESSMMVTYSNLLLSLTN